MRSPSLLLALLFGLALAPRLASAQFTRATSPVALPGYGLTTHDGPEALNLNPAQIAFAPSWGFAYVHSDAGDAEPLLGRGDGFFAASPIYYGIAAGLSIDSVRPTLAANSPERTMVSLALAWQMQNALAVGGAVRFIAADDPGLSGLTTLDLSASWRPADWLALSFMARDVVGPSMGLGLGAVPRSFVLGFGLRPSSERALSFDLAGALDETGRVGARLAAEARIPYAGRVLAAAELEGLDSGTPSTRVTVGLAADWDMYGVGGGVQLGDGLEASPAWYVNARLEGASRGGIPEGDYVLDVPLAGIGPRGIVRTVRLLERAVTDPRIRGVLIRPRGSSIGMAYAQEIRQMIEALQEAGKPVVCHFTDGSGSEWYACAGADRRIVDPAGGVRLVGPSTELFMFGELLRNVGVRADFVRIGRWKSAIEDYLQNEMTGPTRTQRMSVLDFAHRRLLFDGAANLGTSPTQLGAIVDVGPHLADEALERGLVHALADERDMDAELREAFGGAFPRGAGETWRAPERWGNQPRIGVVIVDGTIVDGENVDIPLIGIHASGGDTVVRAIEAFAADPAVVAIVLRVDSPGGSVLSSDLIYRAVARARRRKPVIASLGATATSGGYYVAAPANEIWADPTTVTGSIGVWFGKVDFAPLGRMIGVTLEQLGRGAHSGVTSLYRPFTDEERALLAADVRAWYRTFLRRVARGRGMSVREVDRLGRGRLFVGDEAIDNGLVDHLGGLGSALAAARRAAGVDSSVPIVVAPNRPASLLDYVFGFLGIGAAPFDAVAAEASGLTLARVAPELRSALSMVVTLRHLGASAPLALMPQVIAPQ